MSTRREIVEAGAGCGKTTRLVARYLEALSGSEGMRPSEVIALTFTNEAAAEMRTRVLAKLAEQQRGDLAESVLAESQISTFHSLCIRLLRPRLQDLGYTGDLTLPAVARLQRERHVLRSLAEDPEAETLLRSLSPARILAQAHALWFSRELRKPSLLPQALHGYRERLDAFLRAARADAARVLASYEKELAKTKAKSPWPRAYAQALRSLSAADAKQINFSSCKDISGAEPGVRAQAEIFRDFFREGHGRGLEPSAIAEQIALDASLRSFLSRAIASGPRALDFSALESELLDLLEKEAAEGRRLITPPRLLLVDEFQDTNPAQGRILELLAGPQTELYYVGDPKQSIYAFRGADISLFISLREKLTLLPLDENWRSHASVLAFANLMQAELFGAGGGYDPPGQALRVPAARKPMGHESLAPRVRVEMHPARSDLFPAFLARYRERAAALGPNASHGVLFKTWKGLFGFASKLRTLGLPYSISGAESFLDHQLTDLFCDWLDTEADSGLEQGALGIQRWKKPALSRPDAALDPTILAARSGSFDWSEIFASFCSQARPSRWPQGREWVASMERLIEELRSARLESWMNPADLAAFLRQRGPSHKTELPHGGHESGLRLLTVHGSKGLQYTAVYMPELYERSQRSTQDSLEEEDGLSLALSLEAADGLRFESLDFARAKIERRMREEAETKRLFYVAFTRAEHCIDLFSHSPGKSEPSSDSSYALIGLPTRVPAYWNRLLADMRARGLFDEQIASGAFEWVDVHPTADDLHDDEAPRRWLLPDPLVPLPERPRFFRMGVSAYLRRNEPAPAQASGAHARLKAAAQATLDGTRLHALLETWNGEGAPHAEGDVADAALALRALPELAEFWRARRETPSSVRHEFGVFLVTPEHRLSGFVDAAWFRADDELVLIDWKSSGSLAALRRPERLEKIRAQLRLYADAFRGHYSRIRGWAVGIELGAQPKTAMLFDEAL
jgi:ATP-dependent helicase/nuclease subunit A